jgi:lipoprotein NlpI
MKPIAARAGLALTLLAAAWPGAVGAPSEDVETLWPRIRELLRTRRSEDAIEVASEAIRRSPGEAPLYSLRAFVFSSLHRNDEALADYARALELDPKNPRMWVLRGATQFKLGKIEASIEDYDRAVQLDPASEALHWQRGISFYYAGRYAEGVRQFDLHRTVNPEDVENAVWRFLCMARDPAVGLDRARAELLPVRDDRRAPMREIHRLFAGQGSEEETLAAARAGDPPAEALRQALFYAHLYIGLYREALGDAAGALEHIRRAAREFAVDHYMGDVARVHLELRAAGAATGR